MLTGGETENKPAASVLLPVYNGGKYVARAIESALAQSLSDIELVVVEDGSTDDTPDVLQRYALDERVRVVRHERNLGLVTSLNDGLAVCRSEFVARLDADDVALPTRLQRQKAVFDKHPDTVLCATAYERVLPSGDLIRAACPPLTHGALAIAMMIGNRPCHSTIMFRRSSVLAVGGYDPAWFPVEDYDLWLRLLATGRYCGLPTVEARYLENPDGISASKSDRQQRAHAARVSSYRHSLLGSSDAPRTRREAVRQIDCARRFLARELMERGIPRDGLDEMAYNLALAETKGRPRVRRHLLVAATSPRLWLHGVSRR